jgi:hypothetical protein
VADGGDSGDVHDLLQQVGGAQAYFALELLQFGTRQEIARGAN